MLHPLTSATPLSRTESTATNPIFHSGNILALSIALALFASCLYAPPQARAEFVGKVVGVIDGDSIRVMHEGKAEQIRLLGIDCPEKRQFFGTRAKEYTSELHLAVVSGPDPPTV